MSFNSCKGFIGNWLIYETKPRHEPPKVKFSWDNVFWQEISPADSYTINPVFNFDNQYWYDLVIEYDNRKGTCDQDNDVVIRLGTNPNDPLRLRGDFTLGVWSNNCGGTGFNGVCWGIWGWTYEPWGRDLGTQVTSGCVVYPNSSRSYFKNPPKLVSAKPVGNAPTIQNYELKIFYLNELVYQETRSTSPNVEIIPESCKYYNEDKKLVNIYQNNNSRNFMDLYIVGNTSIVWLLNDWANLLPPIPVPFYMLYRGSSNCNLPPKIDTECVPICLSCPNGTCAVPCGDVICCYNNDGVAVLSIPKERYCNE
jgi:hypothetical protein